MSLKRKSELSLLPSKAPKLEVTEEDLASFYKFRTFRVDEYVSFPIRKVYLTDVKAWRFVFFAVGLDCDIPIMDSLLHGLPEVVEEPEEEEPAAWLGYGPDSPSYQPTTP